MTDRYTTELIFTETLPREWTPSAKPAEDMLNETERRFMKELPDYTPARLDIANTGTPLQKLHRLSAECGVEIFFKRDDFTGSELSGNKVRKLEFLLAEAKRSGADTVITCGGAQSNHCRATALAASRCGMSSTLLLRTPDIDSPPAPEGNILLDMLAGAELIWVTPDEYRQRHLRFESEAARLKKEGKKPYIIPEGGSNALGSWGYALAVREIYSDLRQLGLKDSNNTTILSATGSGGTTAGLLIGNKLFDLGFKIAGVNVCDNKEYFIHEITKISQEFSDSYPVDFTLSPEDISIVDGYVGKGYGIAGRDQLKAMCWLAQLEGIILDPVYTGKAFFGMISELKKNPATFGQRIVFIHTGGIFGLFPIVDQLLECLNPETA